MAADQMTAEIKKLRVNALYGKKRHYNASERKRRIHLALTYAVLVLNLITGSVLFGLIKAHFGEYFPACTALLSAFFIGTSEFFKFGKHATEHHTIGDRYLGIVRDCAGVVALHGDGQIGDADLKARLIELQKVLTEVDTSAGSYPTNRCDYEASRKGVADGEENYTPQELNNTE